MVWLFLKWLKGDFFVSIVMYPYSTVDCVVFFCYSYSNVLDPVLNEDVYVCIQTMTDAEENLGIVTVLLEENEELKHRMENVRKECDKRIEVRNHNWIHWGLKRCWDDLKTTWKRNPWFSLYTIYKGKEHGVCRLLFCFNLFIVSFTRTLKNSHFFKS